MAIRTKNLQVVNFIVAGVAVNVINVELAWVFRYKPTSSAFRPLEH